MRLLEAREFRAMGKPREALRAIEAAMAWDPTNPMLVNEKGVLEYQLGRFAEAEREFVGVLRLVEGASAVRMAIAVNGRRRSCGYLNLAQAYRREGRLEAAQRMLKQVEMLGGAEAVGLEGESDDRDRRPSSRPEACFCTCRDASRRRVRSTSARWRRMERIGRRRCCWRWR